MALEDSITTAPAYGHSLVDTALDGILQDIATARCCSLSFAQCSQNVRHCADLISEIKQHLPPFVYEPYEIPATAIKLLSYGIVQAVESGTERRALDTMNLASFIRAVGRYRQPGEFSS